MRSTAARCSRFASDERTGECGWPQRRGARGGPYAAPMSETSRKARHIWDVVEPIAASAYFAPEAHAAYEKLGFNGSGREAAGGPYPDGGGYFISQGAWMGEGGGHG